MTDIIPLNSIFEIHDKTTGGVIGRLVYLGNKQARVEVYTKARDVLHGKVSAEPVWHVRKDKADLNDEQIAAWTARING